MQEIGRKKLFLENTRAVLVGSRARLNQTQNWSCFVSNLTNSIKKMFMTSTYFKTSTFLGLKTIVCTD